MIAMVQSEATRIDSRFLEPACGNGNFLTAVLEQKIKVCEQNYAKNQIEFERYSIIALSSIYGVDLLADNILECQIRLFKLFDEKYTSLYKEACKPECRAAVKFILSCNILQGDALTMMSTTGDSKPIIFSEWSAVNGSMIKRREYTLANLLAYQPMGEMTLFSDLNEPTIIPTPIKEYPLVHFLKLGEHV